MGFFSSLGDGLSNIGSSVGGWMSNPDNADKMNAWGQELYALGNPQAKVDTNSIYTNFMNSVNNRHAGAAGNAVIQAAAAPVQQAPVQQAAPAPQPLQLAPMQVSPNGVYQPYGLPQNRTPNGLPSLPTMKFGGY